MIDKNFLEKEYVINNKTAKCIAKEINKSDTQVRYWIKYHGLPIKPRGGRHKTIDLTGKIFGEYVVLRQVKGDGYQAVWECKCSCGIIKNVKAGLLKRKEVLSCGDRDRHWKGYGNLTTKYFNVIQHNAKSRKKEFNIDIKYIWDLYISQGRKCAISGVKITINKNYAYKGGKQTASLDRINPLKGYTKGNVQWVHKDINKMKLNHTQNKFIKWCKVIANYQK